MRTFRWPMVFLLAVAQLCPAQTQCFDTWLPGLGYPGTSGAATAMAEWPMGNGGAARARLLVATNGEFAGNVRVNGLAVWDGESWRSFGPGSYYGIKTFCVRRNGDLVVAGSFTEIGGVSANRIAIWNGNSWTPMGSGFNADVRTVIELADGRLLCGGSFTTAGGILASRLAVWNGTSWADWGGGVSMGYEGTVVRCLLELPDGKIAVGGQFLMAGTVGASNVAIWDASTWKPLSSGIDSATSERGAHAIVRLPNGDLIVAGNITRAGSNSSIGNVARWNGSAWSAFGSISGPSNYYEVAVRAMTLDTNGVLHAIGESSLKSWSGTAWSSVNLVTGSGFGLLSASSGELFLCGSLQPFATTFNGKNVAVRRSGVWQPMGSGLQEKWTPELDLIVATPHGVYASGAFDRIGNAVASGLARWDGSGWAALDPKVQCSVGAMVAMANGELLVGGKITGIAGSGTVNLAKWDGVVWTAVASGVNGGVQSLLPLSDGKVVVGGSFQSIGAQTFSNIAVWNGSSWESLGTGVTHPTPSFASVRALIQLGNGDIVAGGNFATAGGVTAICVARWNGNRWFAMGGGLNSAVKCFSLASSGQLIAGGSFSQTSSRYVPNGMARWTGNSWVAVWPTLSAIDVRSLTRVGSDLIVAGLFQPMPGVNATNIVRWNGSTWQPVHEDSPSSWVNAVAVDRGEVHLVGLFDTFGSVVARRHARLGSASTAFFVGSDVGKAIECGGRFEAQSQLAAGYSPMSFQWTRNGVPLKDGVAPSGAIIQGAASSRLSINGIRGDDAGDYRCIANFGCAVANSRKTSLTPLGAGCCPADLASDGIVDDVDFQVFVVAYVLRDCADAAMAAACPADLNRDGFVDDLDFQIFVVAYDALLCP